MHGGHAKRPLLPGPGVSGAVAPRAARNSPAGATPVELSASGLPHGGGGVASRRLRSCMGPWLCGRGASLDGGMEGAVAAPALQVWCPSTQLGVDTAALEGKAVLDPSVMEGEDVSSPDTLDSEVDERMPPGCPAVGSTRPGLSARTGNGMCASARAGELPRELDMSASDPQPGAGERELVREFRWAFMWGAVQALRRGLAWSGLGI